MNFWTTFLAISPLGLFLLGLFFRRLTLTRICLMVLVVVSAIQVFYWKILPMFFLNSAVKGFFVAFDIFLIVFGAVFFLEVLKDGGVIKSISYYLESITKDYRVQVVLLAWFLINFLEGMAGFGTPGAIVAPILVSLGLSPLTAVVVCLLGNSSAGTFGAVGTPIRVGFAGLNVFEVPSYTVLFNAVGVLIPVFMIWILAREQKEKWLHFLEVLPFALWSGFLFVVCSIAVVGLGQEFVSIIGSFLALVLIIVSLRLGLFGPKKIRSLKEKKEILVKLSLGKTMLPYLVVFLLLIGGKYLLKTVEIYFPWGYRHEYSLFNPGVVFLVVGLPLAFILDKGRAIKKYLKISMMRTIDPFLVILAMSMMVQLMISSGNNTSGLPSILQVMTGFLSGDTAPFVAPFMGALGAFLTGSITVSNILFGNVFVSASQIYGLNTAKLLALEMSGAAIGNSMAIADVMAAEAVLGIRGETRSVLRRVVGPCLVCLGILGVVGRAIIR